MKRFFYLTLAFVLLGSTSASAEQIRSLYDVIAPVISGVPAAADRQVGQIFYDVTSGGFKGVNKDGGIDRLSNAAATTSNLPKASASQPDTTQLVFDPQELRSPIIFSTEDFDTSNVYNPNTGIFTAPVTGQYTLNVTLYTGRVYLTGDSVTLYILRNGIDYTIIESSTAYTNVNGFKLSANIDYSMSAGDTIQIVFGMFAQNYQFNPGAMSGWASLKQIP